MPFSFFRRRPASTPVQEEIVALHDSIPVFLLTGFLGSGKTTLLNELLADPALADSAVIVNEFGAIPIDHALVKAGSERYFRTTTGCICCTATSDIRASLFELHEARRLGEIGSFSRVLIETTGLADPAPIINSLIAGGAPALGLRDHVVARHFHLTSVIAAFDAIDGRRTLDQFVEGWKQLAFADHVVVTKTDMAASFVADDLTWLNPAARFHDKHDSAFDIASLMAGDGRYSTQDKPEDVAGWLAMESLSDHSSHAHDPNRHGDGIEALSLTHDEPLDPLKLKLFLELIVSNISSGLLRVKGVVALADDPHRPAVVHAVQHKLYPLQRLEAWPGRSQRTELVLIGRHLRKQQISELFTHLLPTSKTWRKVV
jgi:G3E family GTPase